MFLFFFLVNGIHIFAGENPPAVGEEAPGSSPSPPHKERPPSSPSLPHTSEVQHLDGFGVWGKWFPFK